MRQKFLTSIFLGVIILLACQSSDKTSAKVYLFGKIKNPQLNELKIILFDNFISRNTSPVKTSLNENGEFTLEFNIKNPQYGLLARASSNHPIFLSPGNSLQVTMDDNRIGTTMQFKGKGAEHKNYMSTYNNRYNSIFMKAIRKREPLDFKQYSLGIQQEKEKFYDNYVSSHPCSQLFKEFAAATIKYEYLKMLFWYRGFHAYMNKMHVDSVQLPDDYYDFVKKEDYHNDTALISEEYLETVLAYVFYKIQEEIKKPEDHFKHSYQFGKENLSGLTRDFFLAKMLFRQIGIERKLDEDVYKDFLMVCNSSDATKIVRDKYQKVQMIQNLIGSSVPSEVLETSLFTVAGENIKFKQVLDKNKGKVVYLDFWSIGCGPCIREMPFSVKLKDKLVDQDVTFIYLSADKTDQSWEKGIGFSKISHGHYRMENGFNSKITKFFDIKSIPRYMLLDQDGKIVDLNAKRPSSKEILIDIEQLLN